MQSPDFWCIICDDYGEVFAGGEGTAIGMTLISIFMVIAVIGWLILAAWLLYVTMSIKEINRRARAIARVGEEDTDFVSKVENSLNELELLHDNLNMIKADHGNLVQLLETTIRRVGLVRFDAFEDVGGRQSFAVALLNDYGDGMVISAINTRSEGRAYAKPIKRGKSDFALTAEESRAISEALAKVTKIS